jgi:hypothetical protein
VGGAGALGEDAVGAVGASGAVAMATAGAAGVSSPLTSAKVPKMPPITIEMSVFVFTPFKYLTERNGFLAVKMPSLKLRIY